MNVVITGANRGLGLEMVKQLCEREVVAKVYALCRKTSDQLVALDSPKVVVVEGISPAEDAVVAKLQEYFNSNNNKDDATPIDLLIHNAGAWGPPEDFPDEKSVFMSQSLTNITMDRMRWAFELNTLGPLRVTQALLPNLKKAAAAASDSKVIIISSLMGSISDNGSGSFYGYRTSKAGVNMVGKSLAMDLKGDKIAVGMIHPGAVFTGFGMMDGKDRPEEKRMPGQRDIEPSVKGVLEAIDAITLENTSAFLHGNYGEGVKPCDW